jgi:hypothetical protein
MCGRFTDLLAFAIPSGRHTGGESWVAAGPYLLHRKMICMHC